MTFINIISIKPVNMTTDNWPVVYKPKWQGNCLLRNF